MPSLSASAPLTEGYRMAALRRSQLLDTLPEPAFDRLTTLARRLVKAPISLVSLVDHDRQFFKSLQGLAEPLASERQTPLSHSFCKHVVSTDAPFVVRDARDHQVVRRNPAIDDFGVIAYLGVPVHSPDGYPLGSLCVFDTELRAWTDDDLKALLELAAMAESELALRAAVSAHARTEAQYRALFEASPDAVLVLEPLTETVLDANGPASALYGQPRAVLVGGTLKGAASSPALGTATVTQLLAEGGPAKFESVHRRADGTAFDVAISASVVPLGDRSVVISVNRDVTEQNQADAVLRTSARQAAFREALSTALRSVTDPTEVQAVTARVLGEHLGASRVFYADADPDGDRVHVARDYCDDVPSVAGTHSLSAFGSRVVDEARAGRTLADEDTDADDRFTADERAAYDALGVRSHLVVPVMRAGRLVGLLGAHQSEPRMWTAEEVALAEETAERAWAVSEAARAAEALRESEERFRLLADTATDVILTIDTSSTIRYANRAVEAVFGYAPAELVGTPLAALMPAGLRPGHHAGIDRYVRTGERTVPWGQVETQGLRKDGTEIQIAISFGEYTVGGKRLFTGIIRDTTVQKATQDALTRSEGQFRQIETLSHAVLSSLSQLICVLGPDGVIVTTNASWKRAGAARGANGLAGLDAGTDYLDVCRRAAASGDDLALAALAGITAVLAGERDDFSMEYPCHGPSDRAWYTLCVTQLGGGLGAVLSHQSITELRRSQESLAQNQTRLKAIFEGSLDAVLLADDTGQYVDANPAAAELLGYSREELLRLSVPDILPAGARPGFDERWVVLRARGAASGEFALYRKDGTAVEVEQRATFDVLPGLHLTIIRDITERKAAEAAVAVASRQTAEILESIDDGFFALDADWRFTYVNARTAHHWQREPADLIGQEYWAVFPATVGSTFESHYRRAAETGQPEEFDAYYPPLQVHRAVRVFPFDGGLSVYFRDVTEEKRAEAALRESEERLRLVSQATKDTVWDWDVRTESITMNAAFADVFGWQEPEGGGFTIDWMLERIHPGDRKRVAESLHGIAWGDEQGWEAEYRFERADGTWADVVNRSHIVRSADGRAVRIVGAVVDLTARKATERALVEAKEAAEEAREAAEEVARAKSSLLMNMSHEIRTPLTAVIGYAEL
ncbi:MAG TPA: PAS domain S-box protein, partial [Rubricoccaceae bacterium]